MGNQKIINDPIRECIQNINKLCGDTGTILDVVLEFDNSDFKLYQEQREKLVRELCNIVRQTLQLPDFEQFLEQLPDKKFWSEIETNVKERTEGLLNAALYNSMDKEERTALLKKYFEAVFVDRESSEFVAEQAEDKRTAKVLYRLMLESEYAIVTLYVSKRRFVIGMKESYGLVQEDAEYVWKIFEENFAVVERHEFHRRMFLMNRKLGEINDRIKEINDTIMEIQDLEMLILAGDEDAEA